MTVGLARKLIGPTVGLSILIPLILLMFIGPASRGAPHELPIGVAGPPAAVQQVDQTLERLRPGAFAVRGYTDLDGLTRAAAEREVYGGFAVGPQPVTVVASGGGSTVVALLTEIGEGLAAQSGTSAEIVDVAPPAADDPRGTGFGSIVLPVFMAGAILGIAVTQLAGRARIIAAALPAAAAVIGAAAVGAAMLVGVAAGGFWSQWLAMTAGIWAVSAAIAGLIALIGMAGMGIAALLFMIIGMPLAGIAAPKEFLPGIWGEVGQWLPLGATGTALRSASFFADGRLIGPGAGAAYAVLVGWIVVGCLLLAASTVKRRKLTAEVLARQAQESAGEPVGV